MRNKYIIATSLLAFGMTLASCSDWLEKEPTAEGTETVAFGNAEQFDQAANAFYNHLPAGFGNADYDQDTDIGITTTNGAGSAPETSGTWDGKYGNIRQYNILLQKAEAYGGDKTEINHSVGTALFFRAYAYFDILKTFGGVPIIDHVLDVSDEALYAPRNSRYEVFNFIAEDLRKAIPLLKTQNELGDVNKGKISKEAAQAFFSRVLLYEATWEKYVPGIGYDLDGDGENSGAGKAKPEGYPSVTSMLTECRDMAKAVIDEAKKGTYELWNECDTLSYYYLFNIDEKGGNICNPVGAGKSTNKEFIIYKAYDYDLKRTGAQICHVVFGWNGVRISTQFGESFLCRNGLPIRISRTGNMSDAENNEMFSGWDTFIGEYRNRDYRFVASTYVPDRAQWKNTAIEGNTSLGHPYPEPVYPKNNDKLDGSDPAYNNDAWRAIINPELRDVNSTFDNYGCRKYGVECALRPNRTESLDWPILRLAEVYLNYAEAVCELGNGKISDGDLDISINLLRDRARVAHLSNALIEGVWDAGWWDYAQGKTVCHKMTMLDEIRRERACELFGEGLRMDDLKRWGIAHVNMASGGHNRLGRHVLNSAYTKNKCNSKNFFGQPCYDPENFPLLYGVYEPADTNDPDYGRSIAALASNLHFTQRDYLQALPLLQIRKNETLKQNPGW